MSLADGYTDLAPGKLANVVTCLEMRRRPPSRPSPAGAQFTLERIVQPDLEWYRTIFRRVGEPYLWMSRLLMSDEQLAPVIRDANVEIYAARVGEADAGLLELDFRAAGECELVFFGLLPEYVGKGVGRASMNGAIEIAWSHDITRFWVHTCTLDHPSALAFYVRSGFTPFKRQIEIHDDPRAIGIYPRTAAPDVPLL
jgi:GNAT superfamily N-acetyltransferase